VRHRRHIRPRTHPRWNRFVTTVSEIKDELISIQVRRLRSNCVSGHRHRLSQQLIPPLIAVTLHEMLRQRGLFVFDTRDDSSWKKTTHSITFSTQNHISYLHVLVTSILLHLYFTIPDHQQDIMPPTHKALISFFCNSRYAAISFPLL
jgi:hypothetical protein